MAVHLLRKIYRVLIGKDLNIRTTVRKNKMWYGSHYGGFFVCPDNLTEKSIVYSFGIGEDISFDLEVINKHQCSVYGFDPTPKSIQWLSVQKIPSRFKFYPYGIAAKSGDLEFYLPQNQDYVSGSILKTQGVDQNRKIKVPMKSFADITDDLRHRKVDVLKMDIEGAEYEVLPRILESNIVIDQVLVEFHHRMIENGNYKTKYTVQLLKEKGYEIFAVSDSTEEISFIRKEITNPLL